MLFRRRKKITPGVSSVRTYGFDRTIHRTMHLDVETDKYGNVVAVWFRCQMLPFRQSKVDDARAKSLWMGSTQPENLVAVELLEDVQ